jgi:hypothetical protein
MICHTVTPQLACFEFRIALIIHSNLKIDILYSNSCSILSSKPNDIGSQ